MNKNTITKNLIKIANKIDELGFYMEANTLTKVAIDLNEYPNNDDKDNYDDFNDFSDLFDDTFDGEITKLVPEKGFGIADLDEESRPITFNYDPKKQYEVLNTYESDFLKEGYIIKIHHEGYSGEPEVVAIMKKTSNDFLPFDPYNSGSKNKSMQSFMSSNRPLE